MHEPTRLVILNPTSRLGHSAEAAPAITKELISADSALVLTQYHGHAREIAAGSAAYDQVIVAGGDGTVHEVVNGLMSIPEERRPTLGIVPTGSGNDMARTVGVPLDVAEAIAVIQRGAARPFDIGLCNDTYFANSMSVGLDAFVSKKAEEYKERWKLSGVPLYGLTALAVIFFQFRPFTLTLTVDDDAPHTGEYLICAVTNGPTYGSGMTVNPRAVPDDGLLTMAYVPVLGKLKTLGLFLKLVGGTIETAPEYAWRSVERVTIEVAGDPVPRGADGETEMGNRFEVSVVPGALSIIC